MLATFDLEHNEPAVSRMEGKAVLLAWGGLQLLLSDDEARTLAATVTDILGD